MRCGLQTLQWQHVYFMNSEKEKEKRERKKKRHERRTKIRTERHFIMNGFMPDNLTWNIYWSTRQKREREKCNAQARERLHLFVVSLVLIFFMMQLMCEHVYTAQSTGQERVYSFTIHPSPPTAQVPSPMKVFQGDQAGYYLTVHPVRTAEVL